MQYYRYIYCRPTPATVSELGGVRAVSSGANFSLALLSNGTVMSWGWNENGELGDGAQGIFAYSGIPVPVSGLTGVTAVSAGQYEALALLSNGTVMAWGGPAESDVPVAVSGLSNVTAISAGAYHNLALLKNGTVMAWGANGNGQLGDGSTEPSAGLVAVSGLSNATAISAGLEDSLAVLSNGTVKGWGANEFGQLGDGEHNGSDVPVAVSGLSNATSVSAGRDFSLALLRNGTVKAWGANEAGTARRWQRRRQGRPRDGKRSKRGDRRLGWWGSRSRAAGQSDRHGLGWEHPRRIGQRLRDRMLSALARGPATWS